MKKNYKISITGDLGSGKSTVCDIITKELPNIKLISVGALQREMAKKMGMTTTEFNVYMESHPEIDKELDDMLKTYDGITGEDFLFDSRLAWNFVPSAFSVYVTTDLLEAARRVQKARRENEGYSSVDEAMKKLSERRASEILRYREFYGLNIKDLSNYDLVVDSTTASPDEVANFILSEYDSYVNGREYHRHYLSPMRLYPLACTERGGDIKVCEYKDFYYVIAGADALKRTVKEGKKAVYCSLVAVPAEDKELFIKENCNQELLKSWEDDCGINFVRYPF